MQYLSVCSGIEAASIAWEPLGWRPWAFSEIDPFPSAVLTHRFPNVRNLGDMTKFEDWPDASIDVFVGGTPCQDYSIAGLRAGMAGERGQLTFKFLEIAKRYRPTWIVWENVLGVLSSNKGRDFAAFLGDLGQLGYGWAYRVLDAQYVRTCGRPYAVPQRRRRVFVVGYFGDWRLPAAVLIEPEGLRGDSPPRREAGQTTSTSAVQGLAIRGRDGGSAAELTGNISTALRASQGGGDKAHVITLPHGQARAEIGINHAPTLSCNHEAPIIAHTLRGEGFDATEDGTGRGLPLVPVAFDCKGTQVQFSDDGAMPTLRSMGHLNSDQNGGGHAAVVTEYTVRRITPIEAERLMGFPDNFTNIPWRGKPTAPDGPRYKALGNSMATNCMEYVGRRIQLVADVMRETAATSAAAE